MAKSPPAPELVEAYQLIKSGQRQAAGKVLKAYLAQNQTDPNGWWLMAHAVGKPDNVRKCLETVLKLDPTHAKARAKLAQMADDEPDDSMIFGSSQPAAKIPLPTPEPLPSFEEYIASGADPVDPFAAPPVDDPFVNIPETTSFAADPFESPINLGFDPLAAARTIGPHTGQTQSPGTGNQPEWGPGLAFVAEPVTAPDAAGRPQPPQPMGTPSGDPFGVEDFPAEKKGTSVEMVIGVMVIAIAVVVLIGLLIFMADRQGVLSLSGDSVPEMTTLDGGSFTIDYPKKWDARCKTEQLGYSVCGVANDAFYNQVDWYSDQNVDIGGMLADAFSRAFTGGDLPDEQVSIIVMDVPPTSSAYDDKSWAKSQYEWWQSGWGLYSDSAQVKYDKREMTLDGQTAYYYKFTAEDKSSRYYARQAYYDVYIPHHNNTLTLWFFVQYQGETKHKIPDATVQAMIESIKIKQDW